MYRALMTRNTDRQYNPAGASMRKLRPSISTMYVYRAVQARSLAVTFFLNFNSIKYLLHGNYP